MKNYFKDVSSLEELRQEYKELLKKYHPDNKDGSTEATQAINVEYEQLFERLKNIHKSEYTDNASNKETSYNTNMYDWENDVALREILQQIINFDGIDITIIGNWIWLDGNTYAHKDTLKIIGFKWSKQHKKWHWHYGEYKRYGKKKLSYSEIQNKYGSTKIYVDQRVLLQQV